MALKDTLEKSAYADDPLAEKAEKLDEASEKEQAEYEQALQAAEKAGHPLSKEEAHALRDKIELARLKESKKILKQKYGRE